MQKRLVRKLELEMLLSKIKPHPSPKPSLEQYTIPVDTAATMLYIAAYKYDDIVGKTVLDLGCGTGRLALGAAFLGAKEVTGIDIDETAVEKAFENATRTGLKERVQWIIGDIDVAQGEFDTVLQNPPFGVQRRGADRRFLEKAIEKGKTVYSLHKHPTKDQAPMNRPKSGKADLALTEPSAFLKRFIEEHGGRIRAVYTMPMTIPHMFSFHTKKKHKFMADMLVIVRK